MDIKDWADNIWGQMLQICQETGWPEQFITDVTQHDYDFLHTRKRPTKFGWRLGKYGTDIISDMLSMILLEYYRLREDELWYWCNGKTIVRSTPQSISSQVIAKEHREYYERMLPYGLPRLRPEDRWGEDPEV